MAIYHGTVIFIASGIRDSTSSHVLSPFFNISTGHLIAHSVNLHSPMSPTHTIQSLSGQRVTLAPLSTKIRLSVLSVALVDALGAPAEFGRRFSFPFVSDMIPNSNFHLPAGVWTDDTSMTLCLAMSITTSPETERKWSQHVEGGFDEVHQLRLYTKWKEEGYLSAVDRCFDIGFTINSALQLFRSVERHAPLEILHHIADAFSDEEFSGNGSLMRVLPVGLVYWQHEGRARSLARRSSLTTHPNIMCQEACEVWIGAISLILRKAVEKASDVEHFSKLDLLDYFTNFPYTNEKLRSALGLPAGIILPEDKVERERWFFDNHPLLKLVKETQGPSASLAGSKVVSPDFPYYLPSRAKLPSTGYVLHSIVAALYCFFATRTFEEGALMAVNLGDDADTIGAIYGGLAGCWYSSEQEENVFWSKRVTKWKDELVKRALIEEVADRLVVFSQTHFQ